MVSDSHALFACVVKNQTHCLPVGEYPLGTGKSRSLHLKCTENPIADWLGIEQLWIQLFLIKMNKKGHEDMRRCEPDSNSYSMIGNAFFLVLWKITSCSA